jgi:hypothetical protein
MTTATDPADPERTTPLVVVGAHLLGEPLNPALLALGARFVRATHTAPVYRMVALPALPATPDMPATPRRPGLIRDSVGGGTLEVELYELAVAALGRLMLTVGPPLAIGTVSLIDGTAAPGFVCEGYARESGPDITRYGGWRRYLAATSGCGAGGDVPTRALQVFLADGEAFLDVAPRVGAERDVGVGVQHPGDLAEPAGDDVG